MAHTLIRIVEEIENEMGEMSTGQKHAVFSKLVSNFVVMVFQGNKKVQNEYGTSVAQAFMDWMAGQWEVEPGGKQEFKWDWKYTPADGKGEAKTSPGGGEQN
jgi:hypothetical protein